MPSAACHNSHQLPSHPNRSRPTTTHHHLTCHQAEPSPRKTMGNGKAAVPSRAQVTRLAPRQPKNFVSNNRSEATQMKVRYY